MNKAINNLKINKMNTEVTENQVVNKEIKRLNRDLEIAKKRLKIAESVEIIVNAFLNKENFTFDYNYNRGNHKLFKSETILKFAQLELTLNQINHYENMFKIWNGTGINGTGINDSEFKKLKKAVKFYDSVKDEEELNSCDLMIKIVQSIIK